MREPWKRQCTDYTPGASSPVWGLGFRPINATAIGPVPGGLAWSPSVWGAKSGMVKVQAERYQRMRGLWRLGSYCISGGDVTKGFVWSPVAWARYGQP